MAVKNNCDNMHAKMSYYYGYINGRSNMVLSKINFVPPNRFDFVYSNLWKVEVPNKVKAFGWRCFKNKIPTRDSLLKKGILLASLNLMCVFCDEVSESPSRSFMMCRHSGKVWKDMAEWIGMDYCNPMDFKESFWVWSSFCHQKKVKKGKEGVVWLAILWSLWLSRNEIIFNSSPCNAHDLIWSCKVLVWRWSGIEKITHPNCNFYELSKNPLFYLS
ncbi:uncharacterized protein LOC131657621 [Vicia villosa]|uniref:uncharacterized protein LOC131657621 n=1 Tax=Vicia villosa TaxID=3911 RepID=UPI00273CCFD8|nr:uncharacterized protein LOC131657621 [Vicia villosa]